MMGYGPGWMFGMYYLWWIFWVVIIVVVVAVLLRRPSGGRSGLAQLTPLDILERRYAAGEISTEKFEERKARLTRSPK